MDFFSYIFLCKGEINMILLIIICLLLCPTILLIWLCTCIIKTSRNTQVIAEKLTGTAESKPVSVTSENKVLNTVKSIVVILMGLSLIIASIVLL